jgi:putative membrane protein
MPEANSQAAKAQSVQDPSASVDQLVQLYQEMPPELQRTFLDLHQNLAASPPKPASVAISDQRVRDHLANERTYLAWMRTAIALMGFGVVIARLRNLLTPGIQGTGQGWKLGLVFAIVGLLTVLLSTRHYFAVLNAINHNTYRPFSRWVIVFSLVVITLGAGVLYVLFTIPIGASPSLID